MKNRTPTFFYPSDNHEVKLDEETQSRYWAVKSENLMFTYFEVEPGVRFSRHSHSSEQMTYVLEGVLFFELDDQVFAVKKGDLISIPSFKMHSVWTESEGAKAVDAWSPVNDKY
jgi:quercetin dioxygenase-like cupin family protein